MGMSMTEFFRKKQAVRECVVILDCNEFNRRVSGSHWTLATENFHFEVCRVGSRPGTRGSGRSTGLRLWLTPGAEVLQGEILFTPAGKLYATRDLKFRVRHVPKRVAQKLGLPVEE
jgi:hypothetical protein